jgi:hypothetical protein
MTFVNTILKKKKAKQRSSDPQLMQKQANHLKAVEQQVSSFCLPNKRQHYKQFCRR